MNTPNRIEKIDFLRGIAALSVALMHLSSSTLPEVKLNYLHEFLYYGKYGVQVFFVISGFIIPFSLYKNQYHLQHYFKNVWKRFLRINPPAYINLLFLFLLQGIAFLIAGQFIEGIIDMNTTSVIGNLTFTVDFLNTSWFFPPYWTLEAEWQFYIIIGLLFPLLMKLKDWANCILLIGISLLSLFKDFALLFTYSSFFAVGILLFLHKEKRIRTLFFCMTSLTLFSLCWYTRGTVEAIVFAIAFGVIYAPYSFYHTITDYLGKISYSLYITHFLVLIYMDLLFKRIGLIHLHEYEWGKFILLAINLFVALIFAHYFYKYIEKPFLKYSRKITWKKDP